MVRGSKTLPSRFGTSRCHANHQGYVVGVIAGGASPEADRESLLGR